MTNFTYWYLFPVAIIYATVAVDAGTGGATFFSPPAVIALGLPPHIAIDTVANPAIFTVPGVIVGGQLGLQLSKRSRKSRSCMRSVGWPSRSLW